MTYSKTGEQNYILERVKERIQEVKDKKLKELDLSGCKLTEVPGDVWELEQLDLLILIDNKLTSLPESIGKLSKIGRASCRERV